MNNLKEVTCPRCKGFGYIRGQRLNTGRQLDNYKHIKHGLCFACKGAKVLHMNEDGKLIREENGRILEYDKQNGKYLGILKNKNSKIIFEPVENTDIVFELKESEKIKEREISIKRMIIKVCMEIEKPKDMVVLILQLTMERSKQYCKILAEGDNTKHLEFLENVIPILKDTDKILCKFRQHKKDDVKKFINKYQVYK